MTTQKEILYHCRQCGRSNFVKKAAHKYPPGGSQAAKCSGDFVAQSATPCWTCNFQINRACPDARVIEHSPWQGCPCWARKPDVPSASALSALSVVKSSRSPVPTLNDGHDQATAKELQRRFINAQTGLRRIVSFGLFAWEVKEKKLKHGQFGAWLAGYAPKLARPDTATSRPKPSASVSSYMNLTKNVLESVGFTVNKYLEHISNSQPLGICHSGNYLLLPDKKLSAEAASLKGQICALVDGKTAKQLFSEFKQAEDDGAGNLKTKVGRLKGRGGASHEQRAAKAAANAATDKATLELAAKCFCQWIKANCVDAQIGTQLSDATLQSVNDWCKVGFDYTARILRARNTQTT